MIKYCFSIICLLFTAVMLSQELCSNGIDDDSDGLVDLNDPECSCYDITLQSVLPNHSFEEYEYCPDEPSLIYLAQPWEQATIATSDYMNNCYYIMNTIVDNGLQNFPDGNGIAGGFYREDWREYPGVNLPSPLVTGTNYQLTFQIASATGNTFGNVTEYQSSAFPPVDVTLYGHPNNVVFPVNTTENPNAADPLWQVIGHVSYQPVGEWHEITMSFMPSFDVHSIMIGAPETIPALYTFPPAMDYYLYFAYDNLMLAKSADFKVNVTSSGTVCSNTLQLHSELTTAIPGTVTYQWYKDNIAIVGAVNADYGGPFDMSSSADYCVRIANGSNCYISNRLRVENYVAAPTVIADQADCVNLFGSIVVTTPGAKYSFDSGETWQTSADSGPLEPGRYLVRYKTASGCVSDSVAVDLLPPQLLSSPQYLSVQPSCATAQGSGIYITITEVGSAYSFDDGQTWTTDDTATDLADGAVYFIRYKDLTGCLSESQTVFTIPQYSVNAPTVTVSQPSSCTSNFGVITVTTNAVSYSFDDGNTWSNNPVSGPLVQGTYQVRIKTSVDGCQSYPKQVIINAPPDAPTDPVYNVVQPLSCVNPLGIITITSAAAQYSFDNGTTWSNNPVSGNLTAGEHLIKVRNSANCESAAVSVIVVAPSDYPAAPSFTVVQPDCHLSTGSITITSQGNAYSVDNGVTWQTGPVFNGLVPAAYKAVIKNSMGCVSGATDVVIVPFTAFPVMPVTVSPQAFCVQQFASLNNISITGLNIKWYDAQSGGNLLAGTTLLANNAVYYASQTINTCESQRIAVMINIHDTPAPAGAALQAFCSVQHPALNDIAISGSNINWYGTATSNTALQETALLTDGSVYYATQTVNGCESTNRFPVTISLINTLNANDYSEIFCDEGNDDTEIINLTDYNASLIADTSGCTFQYYASQNGAIGEVFSDLIDTNSGYTLNSGLQSVYARITSDNGCNQIVRLDFTLLPKPIIDLADVVPICQSGNITIDAGIGFDSYLWSTGEITRSVLVSQPGNYSVTVTNHHGNVSCSTVKTFSVVLSDAPIITGIDFQDWTSNENIIEVSTSGSGDYEFSIDGINYQSDHVFSGLHPGLYKVYVRDRNGCGIASKEVALFMYPAFFTPNSDGVNDSWSIKLSYLEPAMQTCIFDRYGKLLTVLDHRHSWDGTYNGNALPADDYWFTVVRANGDEYKGHFSLKR